LSILSLRCSSHRFEPLITGRIIGEATPLPWLKILSIRNYSKSHIYKMVRGGARDAKGQTKKSTAVAGKQSSVSSPILPTSKVKAQKQPACIPSCVTCDTIIMDQVKALQCDRCQSVDKWKCADCLNLPPDMYDHLVSDPNCSLRWFCLVCDKSVMDVNGSSDHHSEEKFGKLTTSVENLLHKLSSLMERYEAMEQRLDEKCNVLLKLLNWSQG